MKVIDYSDCVLYEFYFFVFNGVVYYGKAVKSDWDEGEQPTHFEVSVLYEGDKEICDIWNATLIYQL